MAEGVAVRHAVVGEKDRIVTLFTQEAGKLSAVAKGAR
ncbi:MAG: recombination protein O N-terminal domain-containing protein, partial [Dehalococcoidia bacterium]|nr:recombination protein O N-terminal domain-containing protein [Dehalococcoidia bacterium]